MPTLQMSMGWLCVCVFFKKLFIYLFIFVRMGWLGVKENILLTSSSKADCKNGEFVTFLMI